MRISLYIRKFLPLALLPLQSIADMQPTEQAVDVSVWSIVESRCEEIRGSDGNVECRILAYMMDYKIGYTMHYTLDREKQIGTMLGMVAGSGGLLLPFLPLFTDEALSSDLNFQVAHERKHRVLDMKVDETEPVASTTVDVKIDGTPIGRYKTDESGVISFPAPTDSVVELYGVYDKRFLVLDQSFYFDSDGKFHYHETQSDN